MKTPLILFCAVLVARGLGGEPSKAITPHERIVLFNGKDLSNFTTWETVHGKDQDPDRVFSVVEQIDGAPAIRSSGQHFGGIVTKDSYKNYRLVADFRWGLVTWEPRKDRARDSGILLHCQGEEGNYTKAFNGAWMRSVEFQIIEGGVGDIILVSGYDRDKPEPISPTLKTTVTEGTKRFNPNGKAGEFTRVRIDWLRRDPDWKDVLEFKGRDDAAKPTGQWNHIEAICDGGNLEYYVNGELVNKGWDGSFTEGRLMFQSEGAEIFFRNIELHPLPK